MFNGNYEISSCDNPRQNAHHTVEKTFDLETFQLKFNLKNDLQLEMTDWLSTPVFISEAATQFKLNLNYANYNIIRHPADKNSILVKDVKTKEVIKKVIISSDLDEDFDEEGIQGLLCSYGRLAAVIGGKVHVFDFSRLLDGASRRQAILHMFIIVTSGIIQFSFD